MMDGMELIGVIGGMSWESTAEYLRLLNEGARARLGGLHSARLRVATVDFAPIERMQADGDWAAAADVLAGEARAGGSRGGVRAHRDEHDAQGLRRGGGRRRDPGAASG